MMAGLKEARYLDPNLEALRRKENLAILTPEQQILATAAIVEFALLNCST